MIAYLVAFAAYIHNRDSTERREALDLAVKAYRKAAAEEVTWRCQHEST